MSLFFKRIFITILFGGGLAMSVAAQSWQWGLRGGGGTSNQNVLPHENAAGLTTDKQGNVYAISVLEASGTPTIGNGSNPTALQVFGGRDILISSHTCGGALRWTKTIGTNADDGAGYITADTLGHIYVWGSTASQHTVYFANDTTFANNKQLFIASYDTLGQLLWLRYPASDTIPMLQQYYNNVYDMTADPDGTLNVLAFLRPGLLSGGGNWVVATEGVYMLRYNTLGNIIALVPMQISLKGYATQAQNYVTNISMQMAHAGGRWFIGGSYTGGAPFLLGGQPMTNSAYVAAFRDNGQLLWVRTNDTLYSTVAGRPVADTDGNVYVTGGVWDGDRLNGTTISTQASGGIPMVWKLDSNGHNVWISYASDNRVPFGNAFVSAQTSGTSLSVSNGEVAITGGCGPLNWGNQHLVTQANTGYIVFIARLNSLTGAIIKLDSVTRYPGFNCYGTSMARARNGSYYVGGEFAGEMYIGNDSLLQAGGYTDFFISKYGYPCNCTPPVASVSAATTGILSRSFTFNGTGPAPDSVVWQFGDNSTATGNTVSHTYAGSGDYTVCAIAHSGCGTDMKCTDINIVHNTGIASAALAHVSIYPNPATDNIIISGAAAGCSYKLYTITGSIAGYGSVNSGKQQVSIGSLAQGVYILEVTDAGGVKMQQRIVKL